MDGSTVAISLKQTSQSCQLFGGKASQSHWFSTIPPERRGLHGEFDYYGLSKRVCRCLNTNANITLRRLKVRQRGRVVVLSGQVGSPHLLHQIVNLAMSVDGVDDVETYGVAVAEAC
ncbi:BON domain-containing protein [Leptothoe kymatousa]|uniref:BON domain-containing protein n=1 Tax=Leptothoe kymatousa TAU-MAC 1615 TaxID=2364775 RepID=A0ABS5Y808_9CYAN|nr:BON domain-containing protein [Leptothoe kymatousa]MBT9313075.1 BON domain-containing protein [Leptothoe kymatousa TAU-MAC 1615]